MTGREDSRQSCSRAAGSRRAWGLDGTALKYIAMVSMLIDHIGAVVMEYLVFYRGGLDSLQPILHSPEGAAIYRGIRLLRMLGRAAFPIYCFLLVEGFLHTRSRKKYGIRLLFFAFLSEIPFNLAVSNRLWSLEYQNVFFELAVGLLVLKGLELAKGLAPVSRELAAGTVLLSGGLLALFMRTDYDITGILLIGAFYWFGGTRKGRTAAAGILGFLESWEVTYGAGILSAVPLFFYNGKRGKGRNKYLFYWFYPAHLMALFLLRRYCFGIPLE